MTSRTAAAAIAVLTASGFLVACGSDDPTTTAGSSSSTTIGTEQEPSTSASATVGSSSTSSTPASTSTSSSVAEDTSIAVFPSSRGSLRFDDPVEAASAFATDYVGFVSPEIGDLRESGTGSGEIDVRPSASGPVTVVAVRELDGSWWVLGSTTANIVVSEPAASASVSSPLALSGTSTAFEATIDVRVRGDGSTMPIGEGFVMGGANGEMGPFTGSVPYETPSTDAGAVLLTTSSMESGDVWEATVVRVRFTG